MAEGKKKVFIKDSEVEVGGESEGGGGDLSDLEMVLLSSSSFHHLIREPKLCQSERLLFQLIPHHAVSSGLAFGYLH